MKQKLLLLCTLALALGLLCGCSQADLSQVSDFLTGKDAEEEVPEEAPEEEPAPEPEKEMAADAVLNASEALDVLRLGYQPAFGLNPFTTTSLGNRTIFSLLYEPLFLVNGQFEAEPVLAEDISVSEDGRTTTVKLRGPVEFHTGGFLTAQDVVYSFRMAKASDYYGNRFIHIDTVEAATPNTVVFQTDTPYEALALLLDFPIVKSGTGEQPVPDGTGPFVYNNSYRLLPFDRWWQESWKIDCDYVELTPCDTASDLRDQFEYSHINLVCTDPNSAAYATFHNDSERWGVPTTIMQYVGFNSMKKAFSNAAVRRCISYAIDRETIVKEEMGGFAEAASLPANPLAPCYDHGLASKYDYDLEDFQKILDDAQIADYTGDNILDVYYKGYTVPLEGEMLVVAGNAQKRSTARRIADSLNQLGFHITVKELDADDFADALFYGNFDLYYGEMRMSPNFDLGSFFREGGSAAYGGFISMTSVELCADMLENSGNAYDLHKRIMDQGYFCPVLFKTHALYSTRGAVSDLEPAVEWVIH